MSDEKVPTYNIEVYRGEDFSETYTWLQDDGTPMDLTTYSAIMQVRERTNSELLQEFSSTGSGLSLSGSAGGITLGIPHATTQAFPFSHGKQDLFAINSSGSQIPLFTGDFTVTDNITEIA